MSWNIMSGLLALPCRVAQLEQNAGTASSQLQTLQGQLTAKEADNISLVEKIRYLQRYSNTRQARSGNKQLQLMQVDAAGVPQTTVGFIFTRNR